MCSLICGKFRLKVRLGAGSFGEVFEAEDLKTGELVAVKLENIKSRYPQIEIESKILQELKYGVGIPRFFTVDKDERFRFLSMDLLGKSLDDLFYLCGMKFTLKTVLMIIDQSLDIIEYVHKKQYIYRDIKPNNFLIGRGKRSNQLFLVDFGLSRKYIDEKTGKHVAFSSNHSVAGTARFASPSALSGNQQTRKDDMIALGYLWIFFMKGTLPWASIEGNDSEEKMEKMRIIKQKTPPEELCSKLPSEFSKYLKMVNELGFEEEPKYSEYRFMFRKLFLRYGFFYDYKYDWSGNPQVEPKAPHTPKQKSSSRRPPVSARLLPPTPYERRMQQAHNKNLNNKNENEDETGNENLSPIPQLNIGIPPIPPKKRDSLSKTSRLPRHSIGVIPKYLIQTSDIYDSKDDTNVQIRVKSPSQKQFEKPAPRSRNVSKGKSSLDEIDEPNHIIDEKIPKSDNQHPKKSTIKIASTTNIGNMSSNKFRNIPPVPYLPNLQHINIFPKSKSQRSQSASRSPNSGKNKDILPLINKINKRTSKVIIHDFI